MSVLHGDCAAIPPLRGPTCQKAARRKKSGRSGRNDNWCVGLASKSGEEEKIAGIRRMEKPKSTVRSDCGKGFASILGTVGRG